MNEKELKELLKEGLIEERLIEDLKEEIVGVVKAIKVVAKNLPFFHKNIFLNFSYYMRTGLQNLSNVVIKEDDLLMNIILNFIIDAIIDKKSQINKEKWNYSFCNFYFYKS